jgi:hypothetical protein
MRQSCGVARMSVLRIAGAFAQLHLVAGWYRARSWLTCHTSSDSRRIPRDLVPEHRAATFLTTTVDGLLTSYRSECLCAWRRRPIPQSLDRASAATNNAGISPIARCLYTREDNCASTAPGDDAGVTRSRRPIARLFRDGRPWCEGKESFRAAPACVEQAGTSKTRFHRLKPDGHAAAQHFFYSRPILPHPAPNLPVVPFARPALGLLRRDSSLSQPLIDVIWVELHPECSADQLRHARSAPQFGRETKFRGRMGKPGNDFPLLDQSQFGRTSRMRLGLQTPATVFAVSSHPPRNGLSVNPEKLGNFLMCISRVYTVYGQQPSPLQLGCGSMRSHGILYACSC